MNDEQHLRPHRGQAPAKGFDPELFRQFIENQAQERVLRREETPSRVRTLIQAKRLKAFKYGREWLIDPKTLVPKAGASAQVAEK